MIGRGGALCVHASDRRQVEHRPVILWATAIGSQRGA
jgi:hypothetical protein